MNHRKLRNVFTVVLALIVISSLLGCDLIKSPQIQGALATLTAAAGKQATSAPKSTVAGKATVASKATVEGEATVEGAATATTKPTTVSKATAVTKATVKPKATATTKAAAQELNLLEQGFGQQDSEVAYGMVIENPGDSVLIDSQYQVTVYDSEGTILGTDDGYLAVILPGQRLGIAGTVYLNDGQVADTIEIALESGEQGETDFNAPLTTDQVVYNDTDYWPTAIGLVSNPFDQEVSYVQIWGLAYDSAGNIIGGGSTSVSYIASGTSTGVEMSITSKGEVDRVEFSAALQNSTYYDDSADRIGSENISLVDQGFGQKDAQVAFGALLENASADAAAENIYLHITFYADNGDVAGVSDDYIPVILPGETQAVVSSGSIREGVTVGRIEIQYHVSKMTSASDLPYLTSTNVNYLDDEYSPTVTGQIANPYDIKLENVRVVVIAYDDGGAIIGGGTGSIDFISAGKKAAAEVYVTASGVPANVEMYATANQLSDLLP